MVIGLMGCLLRRGLVGVNMKRLTGGFCRINIRTYEWPREWSKRWLD